MAFPPCKVDPHAGDPPRHTLSYLFLFSGEVGAEWAARLKSEEAPGVAEKNQCSDFSFSCLYAASAMRSLKVLKTWEAPEGSEQPH